MADAISPDLEPVGHALLEAHHAARTAEQRALAYGTDDEYNDASRAENEAWDAWSEYAGENERCWECGADTSAEGFSYCEDHKELDVVRYEIEKGLR